MKPIEHPKPNNPHTFIQERHQSASASNKHTHDITLSIKSDPTEDPSFRATRHQAATIDRARKLGVRLPSRLDLLAEDRFEKIVPIQARFSGYVLYLLFGDTRQMVGEGGDFFAIIPEKKVFDACGKDINARGQFNSSMLETRMRAELHGPDILGAHSFGYLEGDAFGSGILINRWRIRHAYIKLLWNSVSVLMGQFWHPVYIADGECYPNTVSFDGGAPMEPFARQPQLRITKEWQHVRLITTAASQLGFASNGPIGFNTTYMRDAVIPNLDAQLHLFKDKNNLVGVGIDYKRLVPRLVSNKNIKVHESISSFSVIGFAAGLFGDFHIASKVGYLQNTPDLLTLGGYAVSCVSPITDERDYTNIRDAIFWVDIELHKQWSPGIYIGFTKNLGATKPIIQSIADQQTGATESTIYTLLDSNIDYVFRVSPRLRYNADPVTLAGEINFVRAAYGTIGPKGKVCNTDPVNGARIAVGAYLFF